VVNIPPLRRRSGDAALLAHAFVRHCAAEQKRGTLTLLPEALSAIEQHAWPGNVRELQNCVKRAVIMAEGNVLRASDFGLAPAEPANGIRCLKEVREEAEKGAVIRVLAHVNGNMSRAAELLGISRPTLYDLLNRFGFKETQR